VSSVVMSWYQRSEMARGDSRMKTNVVAIAPLKSNRWRLRVVVSIMITNTPSPKLQNTHYYCGLHDPSLRLLPLPLSLGLLSSSSDLSKSCGMRFSLCHC